MAIHWKEYRGVIQMDIEDDLWTLVDEFTIMNNCVTMRGTRIWQNTNTEEERDLFKSLYLISVRKLLKEAQKLLIEWKKLENM